MFTIANEEEGRPRRGDEIQQFVRHQRRNQSAASGLRKTPELRETTEPAPRLA